MTAWRGSARLLLVAALWALCAAGCGGGREAAPAHAAAAGADAPAAPALDISDRTGRPISLADYHGHPVILNFWATWCGPCREEIPSLVALHEELAGDGLEVLAIATDTDPAAVETFLSATPLPFRIAVDTAGAAARQYAVTTIPTTFLLDRDGRVVERVDGKVDWTRKDILGTVRALAHGG